ncbi:glycosyltransferase family 2 protein [Roseimicrobium gellanilyticum]|nr:glycosyltransferase [Roseimicrobium gellanilyticum]
MSASMPEPLVSVVFTTSFPRGRILECIKSWGEGQTLPREQIEIIITGNGKDALLEHRVKQELGPADRFLHLDTTNEAAMYAHSAKHARGAWLFFTEAHVIAAPDTLERLLADVNARNLDGSCVRTLPCEETQWAQRIEARMYEDDFKILSDENDWRKFTKRGFLLRRSAYEAVGGLDARYHRYSVIPVGARLRDQGSRLGHTPHAVVTHYNAEDLDETFDYAREYRRYEQLHLRDHPAVNVGGALVTPHSDASLRKASRRAAWKSLRDRRAGNRTQALALMQSMLPSPSPLWRARLRYWKSRVVLALAGSDAEAQYAAFQRCWQYCGDLSLEEMLHEETNGTASPTSISVPSDGVLRLGDVPRNTLEGFYDVEEWRGQRFRWCTVAASVRLDIPRAEFAISLHLGQLTHPQKDDVRLYWNGRPLKRLPSSTGHGRLAYRLKKGYFRDNGGQILSITCTPAQKQSDSKDSRVLGLPIFQIGFTKVPEP